MTTKTSLAIFSLITICVILSSCASPRFEQAWAASLTNQKRTPSPSGPWTGKWITKTNGHEGNLRCIVTEVENQPDKLQFWYHATWGKGFSAPFKVKYDVVKKSNTHFKIYGASNLGVFGTFKHEADISPSSFKADYSNKKGSIGSFKLSRPK